LAEAPSAFGGGASLGRGAAAHSMGDDFARAQTGAGRQRVLANIAESHAARSASNFPDYGRFDRAYQLASSLDFATAPNAGVFYSGPGNRALALNFARRTARMPIDFTPGGRALEALDLYSNLPSRRADLVWARASEQYANGVSGTVNLFIRGARRERVFRLIEDPILDNNRNVIRRLYRGF
jgi:hypothetical protein